MLFQKIDALHYLAKRRRAHFVAPVLVVKLLRAVDRYAHQPVVITEKAAPLVVEQCAVGLDGVVDDAAGGIFFLKLDHPLVERQRTHQRLAPMPAEKHLRSGLRLDVHTDEPLKRIVGHDKPAVGLLLLVKIVFLEVVTVLACEVAHRSGRLGHNIHRPGKWGMDGFHA